MTGLQRYTAALGGDTVDRLACCPLTMMFASRFIGRTYLDYVMDYRVLTEGQIRVAEAFDFDVVSVISDPCREVHDLGGRCHYFDDDAPACDAREALLADKTTLAALALPDAHGGGRMTDRVHGVALLRERVGADLSVLGWVEGPIALAVDLRGMQPLMLDTIDDEPFIRDLFAFSVDCEIAFARAQVLAGADSIGIGDAAASLVGPAFYQQYVLPEEQRLVAAIRAMGVTTRLHVCGNTTHLAAGFETLGCDLVDIDYLADLAAVRAAMPTPAILGNLEPARYLLRGTPGEIAAMLAECHRIVGPKFVVGAGCEIPKFAPHENVRALSDYARAQPVPPA